MKVYIVIFCFLFSWSLIGQCSLSIKGTTQDQNHHEILSYATIFIPELSKGAVADEKGNFSIDSLCPGLIHLEVTHIGCESKSFYLNLLNDTTLILLLEHHEEVLSEVTIVDHNHQHSMSQSVYSIGGDKLKQLKGHTLADIAAALPGVDIIKTGSNVTKPIIQGLSGNRIAVVSDGVILESQQWGIDHAPEISGDGADKVSVIKSSAPILYGTQAMGGVILVESAKAILDPHLHGDVTSFFQSNGNALGLNTRLQKQFADLAVRGNVAFKKMGDQKTDTYLLNNTGAEEYSGNIKVGKYDEKQSWEIQGSYFSQNLGILRGAHIGNINDLKEALQRDVPFFTEETFSYEIAAPRQSVGHLTTKAQYSKHFGDENFLSVTYNFQNNRRREFDVRRAGRSDIPIVDLNLASHVFNASLEKNNSINHTTLFGLQYKFQNNTNVAGTGSLPLIPDYLSFVPAVFAQHKWKLGKLNLEFGARYENYLYKVYPIRNNVVQDVKRQFHAGALNVGVNYLLQKTSIKADISFIARAPMINELYNSGLHQGIAALEFGDPNLNLEKSLKSTLDLSHNFGKAGTILTTIYLQRVHNFIYFVPQPEPQLTIRGAFLAYNYQNTDALIGGLDGMYVVNLHKNLEWSTKAAYIRARNTILKDEIVFTPPLRVTSSINYDLALSKIKSSSLATKLAVAYSGKQSHVDPSRDFQRAPDAYTLINFHLGYQANLFSNQIKIELQIHNILNRGYRDYLNRLRYFANDLGRNITLNMNYKF